MSTTSIIEDARVETDFLGILLLKMPNKNDHAVCAVKNHTETVH